MAKQTSTTSRRTARSKMDLAAPVSERVEVMEILLAESMTKRGAIRDGLPAKLAMSVNVETQVDKDEKVVCVRLRFVLSVKYDEADDEELLRIEAQFVLRYSMPSFEGLKKANIAAFGKLNGLYNAWPYWREFVQSTTVRMGLPPLTVPVYRPLDAVRRPKEARQRTKRTKKLSQKVQSSVPKQGTGQLN